MKRFLTTIMGLMGYAKISLEAIQLIEKVVYDLSKPNPPLDQIKEALIALKDMLRSGRRLAN